MFTIFDTETSGFLAPNKPFDDPSQGRIMSIAALLLDEECNEVNHFYTLIDIPDHVYVNPGAQEVHGISKEDCKKYGIYIEMALIMLNAFRDKSKYQVCHNFKFDHGMVHQEAVNNTQFALGYVMPHICTMEECTDIVKLPFKTQSHKAYGQKYKWPKLEECMKHFFNESLDGAHDALVDVRATAKLFRHLWKEGYLDKYKSPPAIQ